MAADLVSIVESVSGSMGAAPDWLVNLAMQLVAGRRVVYVRPSGMEEQAIRMLSQREVQAFVEVEHVDGESP